MRPIKFRAWVKLLGVFLDDISIQNGGKTIGMDTDYFEEMLPNGYYLEKGCVKHKSGDKSVEDFLVMEIMEGDEYMWLSEEQFELVEFTGLLQKNGKEIYEGDLKLWDFSGHKWIFVAYWSDVDCGFRWKLVKHNAKRDSDDPDFPTDAEYYEYVIKSNSNARFSMDRWSEIIGNIYETNELLSHG